MQTFCQCQGGITRRYCLHLTLVAYHQLVVYPELVKARGEIIYAILRNIDVSLGNSGIVVGRIDFKDPRQKSQESYYIGRVGIAKNASETGKGGISFNTGEYR